jgi:hypothetical protein
MPVPKALRRAAREGGNIGESPGGDPLVAHAESVVENSKATPTKGLFILEVKSAKLKENKRGPYRSVSGVAADGKMYWAGLPVDCQPEKGDMITLRGEYKGHTFGKEEKPFHKIENPEVVGITDKPASRPMPGVKEALEGAKVSAPDAEGLQGTLESLVKQHGIGKILSVLGEIT